MEEVKPPAPDSRRERARQTRRRMLAAAYDLFVEQGYAPVTMSQIAARAHVAVQTLHFTFHTKAELLQEVIQVYSAGEDDPEPVMDRGWMAEVLATPNPHRQLALMVEHGVEIYRRMAALSPAIAAAATVDADVAAMWRGIAHARRAGMARMIETLAGKAPLRVGLYPERATDLMFVLNSHETFLGLTVGAGWTIEAYKAWLYLTLTDQLLQPAPRGKRVNAAAGLSYAAELAAGFPAGG
jgi:TetR/AcrR family transcriptional regulator of autoinduction and epiphytic fitness